MRAETRYSRRFQFRYVFMCVHLKQNINRPVDVINFVRSTTRKKRTKARNISNAIYSRCINNEHKKMFNRPKAHKFEGVVHKSCIETHVFILPQIKQFFIITTDWKYINRPVPPRVQIRGVGDFKRLFFHYFFCWLILGDFPSEN